LSARVGQVFLQVELFSVVAQVEIVLFKSAALIYAWRLVEMVP
jgi:hypothetical protein